MPLRKLNVFGHYSAPLLVPIEDVGGLPCRSCARISLPRNGSSSPPSGQAPRGASHSSAARKPCHLLWKAVPSARATRARPRPKSCGSPRIPPSPGRYASSPTSSPRCPATLQPTRSLQHLRRRVEGFGFHEVIIDSPDHSSCMALLPDAHVARILSVFKERYNSLEHGPPHQPRHDFQEPRSGCRRQPAASAFPTHRHPRHSQPGPVSPPRSSTSLRRRRRMHVLPHGGTRSRRPDPHCSQE